jgi:hypothetical protein
MASPLSVLLVQPINLSYFFSQLTNALSKYRAIHKATLAGIDRHHNGTALFHAGLDASLFAGG